MRIPREQVLEFLSIGHDGGGSAERELPAYIDTDSDAGLLDELGVDPTALLGQFNGHHSDA
jgi:hypothetical protein